MSSDNNKDDSINDFSPKSRRDFVEKQNIKNIKSLHKPQLKRKFVFKDNSIYKDKEFHSDEAIKKFAEKNDMKKRDFQSKTDLVNEQRVNANDKITGRFRLLRCRFSKLEQIKGKNMRQTS